MRDRLVIIDAVKELMKVEGNTRERVVEMVVESHKVHRGTIYAYLSDESSIRLNKPEARVFKIRDPSNIKKPPSRPTTSVTVKIIELCAEYFHDHGDEANIEELITLCGKHISYNREDSLRHQIQKVVSKMHFVQRSLRKGYHRKFKMLHLLLLSLLPSSQRISEKYSKSTISWEWTPSSTISAIVVSSQSRILLFLVRQTKKTSKA